NGPMPFLPNFDSCVRRSAAGLDAPIELIGDRSVYGKSDATNLGEPRASRQKCDISGKTRYESRRARSETGHNRERSGAREQLVLRDELADQVDEHLEPRAELADLVGDRDLVA